MSIQPSTPVSVRQPSHGAFEVGIYSFVELTPDSATGKQESPAQRLANLLETIELADQVGLDVFGIARMNYAFQRARSQNITR